MPIELRQDTYSRLDGNGESSAVPTNSKGLSSRKLSFSRALAGMALALWFASLFLVGFVTSQSSSPEPLPGYHILQFGWMGLGVICAAWYANPLFLLSILLLTTTNKAPRSLSVIAFLLSLDTFRFANEHSSPYIPSIYAYGLGAVLWFAALLMAMIAAGVRRIEERDGALTLRRFWTDPLTALGSITLCIGAALAVHWTHDDRDGASETELRYLSLAPIKRGPVCKEHVAMPQKTMLLDGPLEVRGDGHTLTTLRYLLALGVPVVRRDAYDFSLSDKSDLGSAVVTPAVGHPSAVLNVRTDAKLNSWIRASLTRFSDGATLFDQRWVKGGRTGHEYCPDFAWQSVSARDQPWRVIAEALGGPKALHPAVSPFVANTVGGVKNQLRAESVSMHVSPMSDSGPSNLACPPDMGLIKEDKLPTIVRSQGLGRAGFRIDNRIFLSDSNPGSQATCLGNNIFLFEIGGSSEGPRIFMHLQSRTMSDFRAGPTRHFSVPYKGKMRLEGGASTLRLHRIVEAGNPLVVEIHNTFSGELLTVTAQFPPDAHQAAKLP